MQEVAIRQHGCCQNHFSSIQVLLFCEFQVGGGSGSCSGAQSCRTFATLWTVACQAPLSIGGREGIL